MKRFERKHAEMAWEMAWEIDNCADGEAPTDPKRDPWASLQGLSPPLPLLPLLSLMLLSPLSVAGAAAVRLPSVARIW